MTAEEKRSKRADYMRQYYAQTDYRLYVCHRHMTQRCYDPSQQEYHCYGGRGIVVCEQWKDDPKAFIAWAKASGFQGGLQIDRIDVNGPYSPENCRWVTSKQNNRNRRNNKLNEEKVLEIRQMIAEGFTNSQIAARFSVHPKMIYNIQNKTAWA